MFICPSRSEHCILTTNAPKIDIDLKLDYPTGHTARVLYDIDDMVNYTVFKLSNISLYDIPFDHEGTKELRGHRIWPFFFWITFIVGLAGNSLVVYVICRMAQLRTVTNMFLLNLAIVDILYLIATIPHTSYGWTDYWPFGEFMCK